MGPATSLTVSPTSLLPSLSPVTEAFSPFSQVIHLGFSYPKAAYPLFLLPEMLPFLSSPVDSSFFRTHHLIYYYLLSPSLTIISKAGFHLLFLHLIILFISFVTVITSRNCLVYLFVYYLLSVLSRQLEGKLTRAEIRIFV